MNYGFKIGFGVMALVVALVVWVYFFVTPQRAMSAAAARDCINVVSLKFEDGKDMRLQSVSAFEPEVNKRKFEDFNRATQAVILRGDMQPIEVSVLLEYGVGAKAICEYFAFYYPDSGYYQGVRLQNVQAGIETLDQPNLLIRKSFNVGVFERLKSIFPVSSRETKYLIR